MDGLTGDGGSHVRDDAGIVRILMRKVFGEDFVVEVGGGCGVVTNREEERVDEDPDLDGPMLDRDVVRGWVLGALRGTKNNSAPGPDGVADRLQDCGDELFHHLQFGSVRGRSATDVLYKAVRTARKVLDDGGSVGWGFWDVKGAFQNVVGEEVLGSVSAVGEIGRAHV